MIQIPVFFSLYKVLLVSIEMRHAPFFGWIKDLAAPDPTTVFTLFGLIPWTPPQYLMLGALPLIMGISMWVQMRLNPAPPDPMQQKIFAWMPVVLPSCWRASRLGWCSTGRGTTSCPLGSKPTL